MARSKKGKTYSKPKAAPRGYKPKPNDRTLDYTQQVQRSKFPGKRTRYMKVDGYDVAITTCPDKRPRQSNRKSSAKKSPKKSSK